LPPTTLLQSAICYITIVSLVFIALRARASADDIVDICDRIEKARAALVQATSRYDKPAGDV